MSRGEKLPMAAPKVPLETLMRWVQAVVVHPHCVSTAVQDDAVRAHLDRTPERVGEVILPSKTLDPMQRIGVYGNMYPLRMRDALKTDFPTVHHILGDDGWASLVDGTSRTTTRGTRT